MKSGIEVRNAGGQVSRAREVLRFLVAGGINTAITYLLYLLATRFVGYQAAYAIAFAAGVALSYVLSLRFVFRQTGNWKKFARYPLVYLAQYVVGAIMLEVLVRALAVPVWIAPLIVVVLTLPLTFLLSRGILADRY